MSSRIIDSRMNGSRMITQRRRACLCIVALGAVALSVSFAEWLETAQGLAEAERRVDEQRSIEKQHKIREAQSCSGRADSCVKPSEPLQSLMQAVRKGAERRHIRILAIKGRPPLEHHHVVESELEISLEGRFADLAALLDELEGSASTVRARRAEFKKAAGQNSVSLHATVSEFGRLSKGKDL